MLILVCETKSTDDKWHPLTLHIFLILVYLHEKMFPKKEAKSSYIWRCNNNKKYQWFNLHSHCILHKLLMLLNWKHCIKIIIPTSYLQQSIKILRRKNFWMNPHWRLASINLMKFNCQNIWQSHDSMMYWSGLASGCELMQPKRPVILPARLKEIPNKNTPK